MFTQDACVRTYIYTYIHACVCMFVKSIFVSLWMAEAGPPGTYISGNHFINYPPFPCLFVPCNPSPLYAIFLSFAFLFLGFSSLYQLGTNGRENRQWQIVYCRHSARTLTFPFKFLVKNRWVVKLPAYICVCGYIKIPFFLFRNVN